MMRIDFGPQYFWGPVLKNILGTLIAAPDSCNIVLHGNTVSMYIVVILIMSAFHEKVAGHFSDRIGGWNVIWQF